MRVIFLLSAAALALTAPAHAETYGKLLGGATLGDEHDFTVGPATGQYDTDLGYTVGGALGHNLSDYFSLEGEVAYRSNEIDGAAALFGDNDLNALSFMTNGVVHGPNQAGGITPYIGGGAGAVRLSALDESDLVFAYQAFGGLNKNFNEKLSAGVEYRYLDANEASFGGLDTEYDSHGVNLTLTRKF